MATGKLYLSPRAWVSVTLQTQECRSIRTIQTKKAILPALVQKVE